MTIHNQNADQLAYWNGPAGQRWAERQAAQDILLGPVADILIDRARPAAGLGSPAAIAELISRATEICRADPGTWRMMKLEMSAPSVP